jgi:hypothetical protein
MVRQVRDGIIGISVAKAKGTFCIDSPSLEIVFVDRFVYNCLFFKRFTTPKFTIL